MSEPQNGAVWRGYLALSVLWLAVLGGTIAVMRRPAGDAIEILPPPTVAPTDLPAPTATPRPLRVDVAGAVLSPGVVTLPPGSIVADAIQAAGGPAPEADLNRINKAVELLDGAQVYVPRAYEDPPEVLVPVQPATPAVSRADASLNLLLDLNTATAAELEALPGIGEVMAGKIIAGRPYGRVEDLLLVKGIGEATLEKLRPYLTVE